MIDKNLLKSYALALYSVAKEKNQVEEYLSDSFVKYSKEMKNCPSSFLLR